MAWARKPRTLPAFIVMSTGSGVSGGSANWSSGFMPTLYAGVRVRNSGSPILDVRSPAGCDTEVQRETLELVTNLDRQRLEAIGDPEIATRISSYEMALRLQTSAPELTNLHTESKATLDLYGCDPDKPSFARSCLLARRMVERGVRFVNIYHEGWDAHSDVAGNVRNNCKATDQGSAALVQDLKQRGLLDSTLVIWGGEFGRTPMVENNFALGRALGRDHHPQTYTIWMAGAGVKPGVTYGNQYRRPRLSHRREPGPRPRHPGHDPARAGLRPREAHLPLRRPRLPLDRCVWQGGAGDSGVISAKICSSLDTVASRNYSCLA